MLVGRGVEAVGIERRGQGGGEGEPEATKGGEDDGGEGVAEDPLEDAGEEHEHASLEEVNAAGRTGQHITGVKA